MLDFSSYYSLALSQDYKSLDALRKRALDAKRFLMFLVWSLLLHWIIVFLVDDPYKWLHLVLISVNLVLGYFAFTTYAASKDYHQHYKSRVLPKMLPMKYPNSQYYPRCSMNPQRFLGSGLYLKKLGSLRGEDHIEGIVNNFNYSITLLHAKFKGPKSPSHDQQGSPPLLTGFFGLFYMINSQYFTNGYVLLFPRDDHDYDPRGHYKIEGKVFPVRHLDLDRELERNFYVFGTNVMETRNFLNPDIKRKILKIRHLFDTPLGISFHQNTVYLMLERDQEIFNINLNSSIGENTAWSHARELYAYLKVVDIMHEGYE